MKDEFRQELGLCAILCALHVMALLFGSERLGVWRPMILEAWCAMRVSLFLLEAVKMLKSRRAIEDSRLDYTFVKQ